MKKRTIKSLEINKSTISKFTHGGAVGVRYPVNTSNTSCLCIDTVCECEHETIR